MNERFPNTTQPEHAEPTSERPGAAYPAPDRTAPDLRRFEVSLRRFGELIAAGIAEAMEKHTEIDDGTARCIAHVLGRAFGRESALAGFGRTGEGGYEALRDEYLAIYNGPDASVQAKELIDWLGTYLVQRENHGTLQRFGNEYLPPKLEQLLVPTGVDVGDWYFTVHVPAHYDRAAIEELAGTLHELQLDKDDALQAFLSLPDVNAMSGDIMKDFHENYIGTFDSFEGAVHGLLELDEWEKEVHEFAVERHLYVESITPDYEALLERARDAYDILEWKDKIYAFYK